MPEQLGGVAALRVCIRCDLGADVVPYGALNAGALAGRSEPVTDEVAAQRCAAATRQDVEADHATAESLGRGKDFAQVVVEHKPLPFTGLLLDNRGT